MSEPDHLASSRAVCDHSADQYLAGVGTAVSERFEAPLDRAVLDAARVTHPHLRFDDVIASLRDCGLEIRAEGRRRPEFADETSPQAFIRLGATTSETFA